MALRWLLLFPLFIAYLFSLLNVRVAHELDRRSVRVGAADEALLATVPEFKHNRLSPEFDAFASELLVIFFQCTRTQCDPAHFGKP